MSEDGWDDWNDGAQMPTNGSSATQPTQFISKGRGISAPVLDEWDYSPSSNGFGGDSGRGRGGGFRGGRGGGRGGGGDRNGGGEDWTCSCGVSNFASRFKCYKCSEPKPNDGGGGGFSNGGGFRGGRGGGDSGGRGEDWTCSCGVSNFASRFKCFKCFEPKPNDGGDSGGYSNGYSSQNNGYGGSRGGGGGNNQNGGGDDQWACACGASNFATRRQCYKCKEDKPFGAGRGSSGGGGNRGNSRPGDWSCSCGQSNFASRTECFKCSESKPEGAGTGGGNGSKEPFDRNKPPLYVPKDYDESEANVFSSGIESGINFDQWENVQVKVSGDGAPKPISSFEEGGLRPILLSNLKKSNYLKPTPIQKYAISVGLAGRDLMGCAQTGSGKTGAFLIPILHNLLEQPGNVSAGACAHPEVLICAPTRELVIQIYEVARKYAYGSVLKICMHYGGASSRYFNAQLEKGCHVLVATTGRLKDILEKGRISFDAVRFVVLDEADRMLDMGFLPDIQQVMQHPSMPDVADRQTLMFSATFPESIQTLASQFMKNYVFIAVGFEGGASKDVQQTILEVSAKEKKRKILELLMQNDEPGVIVFVESTRNVDYVACVLSGENIPATSIHGLREQAQREQALRDFKSQRMRVLVATNVASRGLDIKGVRHVINYDLPSSIDEYVHRIGRTGRVGNAGRATSFFDPGKDSPLASELVRILEQAEQEVPEFLKEMRGGGGGGGRGYGGGSKFGARDIRNDNSGAPKFAEPEEFESWD